MNKINTTSTSTPHVIEAVDADLSDRATLSKSLHRIARAATAYSTAALIEAAIISAGDVNRSPYFIALLKAAKGIADSLDNDEYEDVFDYANEVEGLSGCLMNWAEEMEAEKEWRAS